MLNDILSRFVTKIGAEMKADEDKIAIANYGMLTIAYSVIGIILLFVIAFLLSITRTTMSAFFAAALLRNFSGGAHCAGPLKCLILTCIAFPVIGYISILLTPYLAPYFVFTFIFVFSLSFISVILRAPVDTDNKPITSPLQKSQLKFISLIIVSMLAMAVLVINKKYPEPATAVQLGVLWQTSMLWPYTVGLLKKYDALFSAKRKE
ncbi:MAG: accessory gene regulator B family protein [Bacillota bacterium]